LNKKTGKEVWSHDTRVDGGPRSFHSSPLIDQGLVFISTDRGCGAQGGYVYAFEKQSGKLRWKLKAGGPSTSFAQIGNSIIFGTREDEWVSVDMHSGEQNWAFRDASPDPQCEIRTSPVTDGKRIYLVTHDDVIFALDPSGHKVWTQKPSSAVNTSLFMYKDVLYFGTRDGHVYGTSITNGNLLSEITTPATPKGRFAWGSRGESDSTYVFASQKKEGHDVGVLIAFADEFERVLWSRSAEREWSSEQPHIWKNWVIAGNCNGDVMAYRSADGKLAWSEHVKGCVRSFGHDGSTLYIGVQEGTVYAYQPPKALIP
jgi:outer membrane protein assembly factor BamB